MEVPEAPGGWWRVTLPVEETRTLVGKLVRVIPAADGKSVLVFRGRQTFAVVSDEIVGLEETTQPNTGVPRSLQDRTDDGT